MATNTEDDVEVGSHDLLSELTESVPLPADLMDKAKAFDKARSKLLATGKVLQAKLQVARDHFLQVQASVSRDARIANDEVDKATMEMRDILLEAKLVKEGEVFFLDTKYIDHGMVFINKKPGGTSEGVTIH